MSCENTRTKFKPGIKPNWEDQRLVPSATLAHWLLMVRKTLLRPEKFGTAAEAVPENVMMLFLTHRPFNGAATAMAGAFVSANAGAATCRRIDPSELLLTPATAMR